MSLQVCQVYLVRIVLLFVCVVAVDSGRVAAAPGDAQEAAAARVRKQALEKAQQRIPDLQVKEMLDFYQAYSPDLYREMEERCAQEPAQAEEYIRTLAEHFMAIERLKHDNPEEYKRLIQLEQLESRARELGRRIQRLTGTKRSGKPLPEAVEPARTELATLLRTSFDAEQHNQQVEINRLEAELRELRRLLEERFANRKLILEQRFFQLTGEEWPRNVTFNNPGQGETKQR